MRIDTDWESAATPWRGISDRAAAPPPSILCTQVRGLCIESAEAVRLEPVEADDQKRRFDRNPPQQEPPVREKTRSPRNRVRLGTASGMLAPA